MPDLILDVAELPARLRSRLGGEKVNWHEEDDAIVLTSATKKPRFEHLIGMFADGKMSVDGFLQRKRLDLELEN